MNEKNLKPIKKGELTKEEAKRRGQKGGKKSGEARRQKKQLRDDLEVLLSTVKNNKSVQEKVCLALIEKAIKGDVRAFEVIRDTIGEKPIEKHQVVDKEKIEKVHKELEEALFNARKECGEN